MKINNLIELEKQASNYQRLSPGEREKLKADLNKIRKDLDSTDAERVSYLFDQIKKADNDLGEMKSRLKVDDITSSRQGDTSDNQELESLLEQADDKYYAAEYDSAVELYKRVLQSSPSNSRALEQIEKADLLRSDERIIQSIPRESIQAYRRARSHINAGDVNGAASLLEMALSVAEKTNISFPQAQSLYESLQDAIVAAEYRHNAEKALKNRDWGEATRQLNYALRLDPSDSMAKSLLRQLQNLYSYLDRLKMLEKAPGNLVEQSNAYLDIRSSLETIEYSVATEELSNEIAERLQQVSVKICEQLSKQADSALDQAERSILLRTKAEKFAEAVKYYKQVEQMSAGLVDKSKQAIAENQGEISSRYYEQIKELKETDQWHSDKLRVDEVRLWNAFSPDDPDIRQAVEMIREAESLHQKRKQTTDLENQNKRTLNALGYSVLGVILLFVFVFFITFLYGRVQASLVPTSTPTPKATSIPSLTPVPTLTNTSEPTITPTPKDTPVPSPTPIPFGITTLPAGTYDAPNGNQIGNIGANIVVSVLIRQEVGTDIWFFCKWEINGVKNEGWIRNRIQIITSPSQ